MSILGGVKDRFSDDSGDDSTFEGAEFDSSFEEQGGAEPSRGSDLPNDPQASMQDSQQGSQVRGTAPGEGPNAQGPEMNSRGNRGTGPGQGQEPRRDQPDSMNGSGARQQGGRGQSGARGEQDSGRIRSPNAGAGRPQEGSSSPQLSSDTREKMQDAGFQVADDQPRQAQGSRGGGRSVAQNRDDLEEIKSQNEQIIELLKRINQSLGGGGVERSRHSGRRGR